MAVQRTITCDFPVEGRNCGAPAPIKIGAQLGRVRYDADLCVEHRATVEQLFNRTGLRPAVTTEDSKTLTGYVTASGRTFTAKDARPWLVEQGLAKEKGRIGVELLRRYAEAH